MSFKAIGAQSKATEIVSEIHRLPGACLVESRARYPPFGLVPLRLAHASKAEVLQRQLLYVILDF